MEDLRSRHRRMRRYMRDILLARTDLKGVRSVVLDFLVVPEPWSRRAAPGLYTLVQRFRTPGSEKVWFWAPYTAEAWTEELHDALPEE